MELDDVFWTVSSLKKKPQSAFQMMYYFEHLQFGVLSFAPSGHLVPDQRSAFSEGLNGCENRQRQRLCSKEMMCQSLRFYRVFHASFWKQSVKVGDAASRKLGPIFFR